MSPLVSVPVTCPLDAMVAVWTWFVVTWLRRRAGLGRAREVDAHRMSALGTTRTGEGLWWTMLAATLPNANRASPRRA